MSVAGLGAVHLVEVDPVGVQAPQARLDLLHDPAPRVAAPVRALAHRPWNFVASTTSSRRPASALPTISSDSPGRVDVGGVDEVDPGVERRVDDPDRLVVVGVAPRAEHHRAEAERADLDAGAPSSRISIAESY